MERWCNSFGWIEPDSLRHMGHQNVWKQLLLPNKHCGVLSTWNSMVFLQKQRPLHSQELFC
jgi:hypothetical protein